MNNYFVVDRIEGESYILEDDNGNIIDIEKCYIKEDALEGDILVKHREYYVVDKQETKKRKDAINDFTKGIWVE